MSPHPHTGPTPTPAEFNAQLAAAHALPAGPAREQAITDLVLAAIVTEIGYRAPSVRYTVFDWAPYGGLDAHAFLDTHGAEVEVPGLAGDLAQWSSDLRSPHTAAMIPVSAHGPFLLDLHTHHPAPAPAPAGEAAPLGAPDLGAPQPLSPLTRKDTQMTDDNAASRPRPLTVHDLECPIQVGQEVTFADDPAQRGTVRAVYLHRGIITCEASAPNPVTVHPWELLPADGANEQWHDRMRTLHELQRADASDLVQQRGHEVADQADALSRTLADMAITLRQNQLPDPGEDAIEFAARDVDEELAELRDLRTELAQLIWSD